MDTFSPEFLLKNMSKSFRGFKKTIINRTSNLLIQLLKKLTKHLRSGCFASRQVSTFYLGIFGRFFFISTESFYCPELFLRKCYEGLKNFNFRQLTCNIFLAFLKNWLFYCITYHGNLSVRLISH